MPGAPAKPSASNGVAFDRVLTSPWCRCKETAQLATGQRSGGVRAAEQPGRPQRAPRRAGQSAEGLSGRPRCASTRVLFVTHGIVINALTGINPASGEMVIVKPGPGGEPAVVGRLKVD